MISQKTSKIKKVMDWKKENPKNRYIDDITWEEAQKIAFLASGEPKEFELLERRADCNGNNIPHVILKYRYLDNILGHAEVNKIGIFCNLNIYLGDHYCSTYCQKEIFKLFTDMGFD